MSPYRKWTIAIRPGAGEVLRKITKIVGLNGDGFSVLAPYHKERSGYLFKHLMDLRTLGVRATTWDEGVGFTAEDRVKLTYHTDGFAQFSGENPGKIISGRDPKTREPKGLGLLARSLKSPPISGPSVGMQVWGIEEFETPRDDEKLVTFELNDLYYRNCTPTDANTWHLAVYAFPDEGIPPLHFEGEQAVMLYQPHFITAGIQGAVIKLKMIHLATDKLYLGMYVERFVGRYPVKSGWMLNGPGNYTQYQSGYVLSAIYPREAIPVEGRPSIDRNFPVHPADNQGSAPSQTRLAGEPIDKPGEQSCGGTQTKIDEERLQKNALCDALMREGIDGRQDEDAVARTTVLTDLALELGRKESLACALTWYEALEQKGVYGEQAIILDYGRANAIAGDRYGTQWKWEQPTLAREIFYLRRAVSHPKFTEIRDVTKCMCLNNLGNRLCVAGRAIEALECWRRALEVRPNFGMSLCNLAKLLTEYAEGLEDPEVKTLVLWAAHTEASAALAPTALYTSVRDEANRETTRKLKEWIESFVDVKGITAHDPLASQDNSATEEERAYRHWCLVNRLYLNPLNDLGPYTVAIGDSMGLPTHIVPVDAPHTFTSFFDQMIQEYVSARWLLYEGLTVRKPHFSDRDVLLQATEPRPSLSVAIEKVKAAYRIVYSLFDKVGFFMNAYMELGIPEKRVSFRTLWRADENKPIRGEFDLTGNWGFCALYWLAKDFFEEANDEVAEPQARGLSEIRNFIEHKYLRVTVAESPTVPPNDLALMVTREQFERKAVHLMKLARSALIYLAIGVGFEERRREPGRAGLPLEEIPSTPSLSDAEKI
jgi:hypothetical protein